MNFIDLKNLEWLMPILNKIEPQYLYLLGISLPFITLFLMIVNIISNIFGSTKQKTIAKRKRQRMLEQLPDVVRQSFEAGQPTAKGTSRLLKNWHKLLSQKIKKTGWKVRPFTFMALSFMLAMFGLTVGMLFFEDIVMTIAIVAVLNFFPYLILNWAAQKQEQKVMNQLSVAIQLFAVEFEMNSDIREAMLKASRGVKKPLSQILERSAQELAASKRPKDVFVKLSNRLNNEHGRMWAQMLLASTQDITVVKLMPRLVSMLGGQRLLQQKNVLQLSGERRIGIILNMLIIPGFIFTQLKFPTTVEFYSTPFGRIVIIIIFLSYAIGIALDQLLRRVEM